MKAPLTFFALLVVALASPACSLTTNPINSVTTARHQPTPITSRARQRNLQDQPSAAAAATTPSCGVSSRSAFLSSSCTAAAALLFCSVAGSRPALAATVDPSLKGTKKDPAFEACLSQCMYDCTKPKGAEQKSRAECLPDCKQKCATTKQQLLKGTPIAAAAAQDT